MKIHHISHLIKSEDLNHHGTLFAGRSAEWLVEAGFIAAASETRKPEEVVCINIHGFVFKSPVKKGEILNLESRVAKVGNSSITVYVEAITEMDSISRVDGFITFVSIDEESRKKKAHGLLLDSPKDDKEEKIREKANKL